MPEYAYIARDRAGRTVEGSIIADSSALAAGRIQEMGLVLERIRPAQARPGAASLATRFVDMFVRPIVSGIRLSDLVVFYRQFATLIGAGIPLHQTLVALESQTKNPTLKRILGDCQQQVMRGGRLSDVLEAYPWAFSDLQLEMIRAAEQGGMLELMLTNIADYLEQEQELRRTISRLTLYPKLVLVSALFLIGKSFFLDLSSPMTPAVARLVLGTMGVAGEAYTGLDYLNDTLFFGLELLVIGFLIMAFCRLVLFQSDSARTGYERVKMAIPGLGSVVRGFALAKFGRAFGAMYAAGMPMSSAIRVGGNASGSRVLSLATEQAIAASERGATLSSALADTGAFPPLVLDMLRSGEATGNVDAMMGKVAEYLEGDATSKAHVYSHIFAIGVHLLVAILVGVAVIRFWGGYMGGVSAATSAN